MLRVIYTLLHYLAIPGILIRLLWRSRHSAGYRKRWNERFGYIKRNLQTNKSIWVHAVSVGEAIAAIPLIKELKARYPEQSIVVTTTTPTGSVQIRKHLQDQVMHVYTPYDVPSMVNRFLRRSRTRLCIIMETEMWPNLLRCCRKSGIPVILANGRLSERSKLRYQLIAQLTKHMLRSYTAVATQGVLDGERLLSLGLDPKALTVTGNIKYDIRLDNDIANQGRALRLAWNTQHRPTLIAASTHEGEEKIILRAFKILRKKIDNALLVLVPRHPDRFSKVEKLCIQAGFNTTLRSHKKPAAPDTHVIIGDTMGELILLYAAADVAFVGGSLANIGGHNVIEPAAIGLPILTGPYLHNFTEISKILQEAGVAQVIADGKSLAKAVIALIASDSLRKKIGERAKEVITANRGALARHMEIIEKIHPPAYTKNQLKTQTHRIYKIH